MPHTERVHVCVLLHETGRGRQLAPVLTVDHPIYLTTTYKKKKRNVGMPPTMVLLIVPTCALCFVVLLTSHQFRECLLRLLEGIETQLVLHIPRTLFNIGTVV